MIAPDINVFREVLGHAGVLLPHALETVQADCIAAMIGEPGWRARHAAEAAGNLKRWNTLAAADRAEVVTLLSRLSG